MKNICLADAYDTTKPQGDQGIYTTGFPEIQKWYNWVEHFASNIDGYDFKKLLMLYQEAYDL